MVKKVAPKRRLTPAAQELANLRAEVTKVRREIDYINRAHNPTREEIAGFRNDMNNIFLGVHKRLDGIEQLLKAWRRYDVESHGG